MSDFEKRCYDPRLHEDGVVYLWLKSYAHTRENIAAGAHRDRSPAERRYWAGHAPIVEAILARAKTEVLIADPAAPHVIAGFACTEGDVVHYVVVKRDYTREGFAPEMVRDLLGDRLDRACVLTHDLADIRAPEKWTVDRWWVTRELVGGARKAA